MNTGVCEATLPIGDGKSLDYNQLGRRDEALVRYIVDCLGDLRVSVSLNSDINLIEKGAVGYTTLVGHQGPANTCSYSRNMGSAVGYTTLVGHQGPANTCSYSRNMGSVLTAGSDGRVIEWSQGRGRLITVNLLNGSDA